MMLDQLAKILGKFSLKKMFYLCMLFFILIPFTGITIFINYYAQNLLSKQTSENMLQVLTRSEKNISIFLSEVEAVSLEIVSNEAMQRYIKDYYGNQQADIIQGERLKYSVMESFRVLMGTKNKLRSLFISDNGETIFRYGETASNETTLYHQEAIRQNGRVVWTPAYLEFNQYVARDRLVISCIRQIRDLDSTQYLGVARVTFEEDALCDIYTVSSQVSSGEAFIVDRDGFVISSPDKEAVAHKTSAFDSQLLRGTRGYVTDAGGDTPHALFYTSITDTGWYLVQLVPHSSLNGSMQVITGISVLFVLLFLLFGVVFIAVQNRCVVLPLVSLSREMEQVKDGVFEPQIDIPSENEIGRLTYLFLDMTDRLKTLFETVYKAKLQEREAELRALQSQISPHFLYNCLGSIYWLAYQNQDYEVGRQVEALSNLFRHTLNNGAEITTIGKEIDHLENYMCLQRGKIGDRIALHTQVDEGLLEHKIIKLILQPLVENAVYHGLECKKSPGEINVTIRQDGERILFKVADNGLGTDQERIRRLLADPTQTQHVFALKNIDQRVKLHYGAEYGLEFYSIEGEGTTVHVTVPLEEGGIQTCDS